MTVDIHRPFPHQAAASTVMPTKLPASSSGRIPLQSRNPNTVGAVGSFNNSSTEEYNSKDLGALNRLSNLETSNNENNRRIMTTSTTNSHNGQPAVRRDSASNQSSEQRDRPDPDPCQHYNPQTSSSLPRSSSLTRSSSLPNSTTVDEDTVIIEEKRKRVNGDGYTVHRYMRGRLLGKGGFAKVYLCTAMDTNKAYAIKIVPKANLVKARARQKVGSQCTYNAILAYLLHLLTWFLSSSLSQLQAEIKIHRTLKHKHICEYKHFFEDKQNCYILLELCHNQSLNEMIKRRKRLTEPETAFFMRQLLEAMQYMHEQLVIHRDLKLGNLFLDRNLNVKVGDLGLATRLETKDEKRKTICGTPNYIAPEVIQGDRATRGHSFEVDIWSMGVVLYTCLVGKPPYEAKDVKATYQRILANEYSFPRDVALSENAKDMIRSMLQSRPEDRPSLSQIASHPFFSDRFIPNALPASATHVTPVWQENQFGELVAMVDTEGEISYKKPCLPRKPFASRDVNAERASDRSRSKSATKAGRDVDVVPGVVKNAITAVRNVGGKSPAVATPAFQVYDENPTSAEPDSVISKPSLRKTPQSRPDDEDIVARAAALSIGAHHDGYQQTAVNPSPRGPLPSPSPTNSSPEPDGVILHHMLERLNTVLEITENREYSPANAQSLSLTPFTRGGPTKWVSRYVDYTSKYGLGFLLNDGR